MANDKIAAVPNPELLRAYAAIGEDLPGKIIDSWQAGHRRSFTYALIALMIGGVLALSLVCGFIYLVILGHGGYASALLGAGAVSMVAGFRSVRLG